MRTQTSKLVDRLQNLVGRRLTFSPSAHSQCFVRDPRNPSASHGRPGPRPSEHCGLPRKNVCGADPVRSREGRAGPRHARDETHEENREDVLSMLCVNYARSRSSVLRRGLLYKERILRLLRTANKRPPNSGSFGQPSQRTCLTLIVYLCAAMQCLFKCNEHLRSNLTSRSSLPSGF